MTRLFNRRRLLAVMPALSVAPVVHAQVKDLNDAINKAGRQRMLSQRCAKAWLAIAHEVRRDLADRVLSDSMALFDRQLAELRGFAPTTELRATYELLDRAWSDYKLALVGSAPAKAKASAMWIAAGRVLQVAHQGAVQLEQVSGKPVGKLVNVAGRQRMLSQRMAAIYLGATWSLSAEAANRELGDARDEFVKAHALLKSAPEATPAIRDELQLAEQQFGFFDAALRTLRGGPPDPRSLVEVFTTSERILQVMDGVTAQFARLA